MKKVLSVLGLGAMLVVLMLAVNPNGEAEASCALKMESGVMCDTICDKELMCFDESAGVCCWDGDYTCGESVDCRECQGPGCTPGDYG